MRSNSLLGYRFRRLRNSSIHRIIDRRNRSDIPRPHLIHRVEGRKVRSRRPEVVTASCQVVEGTDEVGLREVDRISLDTERNESTANCVVWVVCEPDAP